MSFKRIRECTGTYFNVNRSSKAWQLCYIDCPDRIACTGSAGNCISDRSNCIKDVTFERIRECTGTYFNVNCCSEQWLLGYIDRSDGITGTGSAGNCISDRSNCIKDVTFERIRECTGTYFNVNCCSEQWLLGYIDCSDGITGTGSAGNCISDRFNCIKDVTFERIRECTGAYINVNCSSKEWQLGYSDCSDRIAC